MSKPTEVLSDVTGVTGPRIVRAIPAGEREAHAPGGVGLAQVRQDQRRVRAGPCKARGSRGARSSRKRAHDPFETYRRPVDECDRRIEAELATQTGSGGRQAAAAQSPRPPRPQEERPALHGDGPPVPGVWRGPDRDRRNSTSARHWWSWRKIGVDVSRFPDREALRVVAGAVPEHVRGATRARRNARRGTGRVG